LNGADFETAVALEDVCPASVQSSVYHKVVPGEGSGTVTEDAPALVAGLAVHGPVAELPV
jgi:hypothetical protein